MLIQCRSARCISVADSSGTATLSADDTATRETASLPSGFSPFLAPRQFEESRHIQAVTRFSRLQDEKFSGRSLDTVASATTVSAWCRLVSPRSLLGTVISRCGHSVDGLDRNSGHVHHVLLVASEVAGIPRVGRSAGLILGAHVAIAEVMWHVESPRFLHRCLCGIVGCGISASTTH